MENIQERVKIVPSRQNYDYFICCFCRFAVCSVSLHMKGWDEQ